MLVKRYRKGNPRASIENRMATPQKIKNRTTIWSSNFISGFYPNKTKTLTEKDRRYLVDSASSMLVSNIKPCTSKCTQSGQWNCEWLTESATTVPSVACFSQKAQRWAHKPRGTLSSTEEERMYNGEKTVSLISGAGQTGQPLVKEWN